jgi:hypothetical protein
MRKLLLIAVGAVALAAAARIPAALAQDTRVSGNLFISPCGEPFRAGRTEPYPIVKWFQGADANHDGKLDIDEMRDDAARFFKVLDRNGDGVIDDAEINYYENRIVPQILVSRLDTGLIRVDLQGDIDSAGTHIQHEAPTAEDELNADHGAMYFSLFREPEPVRSADRDFNQKVTLKEFLAHSDRHFHALDRANQGYLTLATLPKTEAEVAAKAHRLGLK